jgi:hypothetical protein
MIAGMNNMRAVTIMRALLSACAFLALPVGSCMANEFPQMSEIQKLFVVPNVQKADVSLKLRSIDGVPVYLLQCHSAGYEGDPDFDYSGDFECRLSSLDGRDTYSTLLTEDVQQSKDWESRGRFFAADLYGDCAKIPNFGEVRSFELRNMRLTLKVVDSQINASGKLVSLQLLVTVKPDLSAVTAISKIVPIPRDAPVACHLSEYFAGAMSTK